MRCSSRSVRAVIAACGGVVAAALFGSLLSVVVPVGGGVTSAGAAESVRAPAKSLVVGAAAAEKLGFPVVVAEPTSTNQTGTTFCPKSTYASYADAARTTGITFTVFACTSPKSGKKVLTELAKNAAPTPEVVLPASLPSAFLLAQPPGYTVWWQRGGRIVQVAFTTDLSRSGAGAAISAAQGKALVAAVARQNKLLGKG